MQDQAHGEYSPEGHSPEGGAADQGGSGADGGAGPRYMGNEGVPVHIAGAGAMGMTILLASLTMLFGGSMAALIVVRVNSTHWASGMPALPESLWISTLVLLASSVTSQFALWAVKKDEEKNLVRFLSATLVLGYLFLGLQLLNWLEFYHAIVVKGVAATGAYLMMFYVLTGLHAAHVIGGLIPLTVTWRRAKQGRYSRNFYPGVRYTTAYWHFLDVIWVVLFAVIFLF